MNYGKLINVMGNFDEHYIKSLLGPLTDSLIEWSFGKDILLKQNLIELVVSLYGMKLFSNSDFRKKYYLSLEEKDLYYYANIAKLELLESDDFISVAKKLANIPFDNNCLYNYLIEEFEANDFSFVDNKDSELYEKVEPSGGKFFELYDYQYMIKQQVINDLENPDKGLYKILVHMPTGTGKTKTTMHIISHFLNFISNGCGIVIWIAHTNELLQQAYDTFYNVWSKLGLSTINVYKGWNGYPNELKDGILFTSIQSLISKMNKPVFDYIESHASLIIFDEVHKAGAEKYSNCIEKLMEYGNDYGKRFIGLTATPGRTTEISTENELFSSNFDRIIGIDVDKVNYISLSENEANNYQGSKDVIRYFQDRKILSILEREELDYTITDFSIIEQLKKERSSKKNDYSDDLIERISYNMSRNAKIVEKLQELNDQGIPTIVFACSLQHAKMLAAFLKLNEIPNSIVYGDMKPFARKKAIDDFKNKENPTNIIINYDILTTGFDSANIKCVFITRPTKSVILYSQMIGRGLRGPKMGGNSICKLIDVKENLESFNENDAFKHFDKYWR